MSELTDLGERIARLASDELTVVTAESVTAGRVGQELAAAPDSSDWFEAGIVAYRTSSKRQVLGVRADDVITLECAVQMAEGALALTGAGVVVAVTGVGGPDPVDEHPAGTVLMCAGSVGDLRVYEHSFEGGPEEVINQATLEALRHVEEALLRRHRA